MSDSVVTKLVDILTNRILGSATRAPITRDTALLSAGLGLDSVAVLELVVAAESTFGVEFNDSELSVDMLRSVGAFADAIDRKLGDGRIGARESPG